MENAGVYMLENTSRPGVKNISRGPLGEKYEQGKRKRGEM
jgi:hypothetical protein